MENSVCKCAVRVEKSAEIGIQWRKLTQKMLPVRTEYVDGQIGLPIPLSCCKNANDYIFSV